MEQTTYTLTDSALRELCTSLLDDGVSRYIVEGAFEDLSGGETMPDPCARCHALDDGTFSPPTENSDHVLCIPCIEFLEII